MENFLVRTKWAGEQVIFSPQTDFILLGSYFNDVCCTFQLWQMFIRFSSIIFDIYWSLALQLSCIMVRLLDGMFLFPLAVSFSKNKLVVFYGDQLIF